MSKARVVLHTIIQDSPDYGSDADHMVSRVFFTLDVDGTRYEDMYVDVTQPYGTTYQEETLEVGRPQGPYEGNWNHNAFRDVVEHYYRRMIREQGGMIGIGYSARNIRMQNNVIGGPPTEYEFEIPDQ